MKFNDLTADERELVQAALDARAHSQSPYSNYCVGAAVRSISGSLSRGCNIERANYTSSSHAEQVAIDGLIVAHGPAGIAAIAVAGAPRGIFPDAPVWPCGHCRAIIWENALGNEHVSIITITGPDEVEVSTIGELYPKPFGPEDLGIKIA